MNIFYLKTRIDKTLENLLYSGISQAFNPKALIVAVDFGRSSDFPLSEAFPSYSCLAFSNSGAGFGDFYFRDYSSGYCSGLPLQVTGFPIKPLGHQ